MEGFLEIRKVHSVFGGWKRRYCRVARHIFSVYDLLPAATGGRRGRRGKHKGKDGRGNVIVRRRKIDLRSCCDVHYGIDLDPSVTTSKDRTFYIRTDRRLYTFRAPSKQTCDAWMAVLSPFHTSHSPDAGAGVALIAVGADGHAPVAVVEEPLLPSNSLKEVILRTISFLEQHESSWWLLESGHSPPPPPQPPSQPEAEAANNEGDGLDAADHVHVLLFSPEEVPSDIELFINLLSSPTGYVMAPTTTVATVLAVLLRSLYALPETPFTSSRIASFLGCDEVSSFSSSAPPQGFLAVAPPVSSYSVSSLGRPASRGALKQLLDELPAVFRTLLSRLCSLADVMARSSASSHLVSSVEKVPPSIILSDTAAHLAKEQARFHEIITAVAQLLAPALCEEEPRPEAALTLPAVARFLDPQRHQARESCPQCEMESKALDSLERVQMARLLHVLISRHEQFLLSDVLPSGEHRAGADSLRESHSRSTSPPRHPTARNGFIHHERHESGSAAASHASWHALLGGLAVRERPAGTERTHDRREEKWHEGRGQSNGVLSRRGSNMHDRVLSRSEVEMISHSRVDSEPWNESVPQEDDRASQELDLPSLSEADDNEHDEIHSNGGLEANATSRDDASEESVCTHCTLTADGLERKDERFATPNEPAGPQGQDHIRSQSRSTLKQQQEERERVAGSRAASSNSLAHLSEGKAPSNRQLHEAPDEPNQSAQAGAEASHVRQAPLEEQ